MTIKKPLLALTLSLTAIAASIPASAQTDAELKPLRVSLSDAAEQFHQEQQRIRRSYPSLPARIQFYQQQTQAKLPKTLSKQLTFKKVEHNHSKVFHHYLLPSYQSNAKLNDTVVRLTRIVALKDFCQDNPEAKNLLQKKVDFVFYFNDKNGQPLLEETMGLSDCQQ